MQEGRDATQAGSPEGHPEEVSSDPGNAGAAAPRRKEVRGRAESTRRGLSIFQKLLILMLSLIGVTVALPTVYLPSRQLARMHAVMEAKAEAYSRLVSKQVESAIAFNDQETAREVFDAVALDPDVASLTLFTARGRVLRAHGRMSPGVGPPWPDGRRMQLRGTRVVEIAPVISPEGPRGTLVLELSLERLELHRQEITRQALLTCLGALLLGGVGAFWIARSLANRLTAIARLANAVRDGDLNQSALRDDSRDEIGVVVRAFNDMLQQLRSLISQMQHGAREEQRRLEHLVAERTSELDSRNAELRLVLDHVGQGFVTLDRDGKMPSEISASLARWVGPSPGRLLFSDYLRAASEPVGAWFALGWDALASEILPLDLALEQLPKHLEVAERTLHIGYRPILDAAGKLERVLVVVSDLTPELTRMRAEADERELTKLFTRLLSDRSGLMEFRGEVAALLEKIDAEPDAASLKVHLHTLKGSAALYGVDSIAVLCHDLEEHLSENGKFAPAQLGQLAQRWHELDSKLQAVLAKETSKLDIELCEYEELCDAVEQGLPRSELLERLRDWRKEPVRARLVRLAEHAEQLAQRLDKGPIEVRVEAGPLRLSGAQWAGFWSAAVHVVRNAVDHGLEPADERRQHDKPLPARLELSAKIAGDRLLVEFSDDGRGIDWQALGEKAEGLGIPAASEEELVEALFASGVSTRERADAVSGRGVGLGAARDACRELGGRVEVLTRAGAGTTFRFSWPAPLVASGRVLAPTPVSHLSAGWCALTPSHAAHENTEKGSLQLASK
jgi:signal transduction histidine kinase